MKHSAESSQRLDLNSTQLLARASQGNAQAKKQLFKEIYEHLRELAKRISPTAEETLGPTAIVHEAYVRLVDEREQSVHSRNHFVAIAATAMRHVVIDYTRAKGRVKRGGGAEQVVFDSVFAQYADKSEDIIAAHELVERLGAADPEMAQVVELKFFAGQDMKDVAEIMGVSKRHAERKWTLARALLQSDVEGPN